MYMRERGERERERERRERERERERRGGRKKERWSDVGREKNKN